MVPSLAGATVFCVDMSMWLATGFSSFCIEGVGAAGDAGAIGGANGFVLLGSGGVTRAFSFSFGMPRLRATGWAGGSSGLCIGWCCTPSVPLLDGFVYVVRRRDAGEAGRASLVVGAFVSPRISCNCCCRSMVAETICSQFGSGWPVIFVVAQEETGWGLPNGGLVRRWPVRCPRSPSVTVMAEEFMSMRTSGMRLRPCCPKKLRLCFTN